MGLNHQDAARNWLWNCLGDNRHPMRGSNVFGDGDSLYSYGYHFTLARAIRESAPRRGGRGEVHLFVLNGDTYSNTTSGHQSQTRAAMTLTSVPNIIIPFSVLEAAGIDLDTVRLLDRTNESTETKTHTSEERPVGSVFTIRDIGEYQEESDEEWDRRIAEHNENTHAGTWPHGVHLAVQKPQDPYWVNFHLGDDKIPVQTRITMPRNERLWRSCVAQQKVLLRSARRGADEITVNVEPDGTKWYEWETHRHWLGESLIEAEVEYTATIKCKDCGGTGTRPWVGELWEQRCTGCTSRWSSTETNGRTTGRRVVHRRRKAKFLSGFDRGEVRPSYFFTELPKTSATTIDEALEALKPDTVRLAEQMGRDVSRQGDIFAVPLEHLDKRTIRTLGVRGDFTKMGNLLGTNHEATEVAYLRDGRTLARGTLWHKPEGRNPDHRRVALAKGKWHLIVKNTTPLSA